MASLLSISSSSSGRAPFLESIVLAVVDSEPLHGIKIAQLDLLQAVFPAKVQYAAQGYVVAYMYSLSSWAFFCSPCILHIGVEVDSYDPIKALAQDHAYWHVVGKATVNAFLSPISTGLEKGRLHS